MDNINYIDMPVSEFTAALASSSPAPGGGARPRSRRRSAHRSAAWWVSSPSASLKYAANEPRLRELIAEAQSLRERR